MDRSCQRTTRQDEKNQSQTEGEETQVMIVAIPGIQTNILFIPLIGITITRAIGSLFRLISREFCGFNNDFNVFNECEWEQSGLNNEYGFDFDFDVLQLVEQQGNRHQHVMLLQQVLL